METYQTDINDYTWRMEIESEAAAVIKLSLDKMACVIGFYVSQSLWPEDESTPIRWVHPEARR